MSIQGKLRLGYFPLPLDEARRIRACLRFPASPFSVIDPCIGDGAVFLAITEETYAHRYGVDLDAYRAEQPPPLWMRSFMAIALRCTVRSNPADSCS
jgi:Uncharacterised methyltransferase family (DUF6094)